MLYNKYFTLKNHKSIIKQSLTINNYYHLILNFTNQRNQNQKKVIDKIVKNLPQGTKIFGWACGTKKKFIVGEKNHKKTPHIHLIVMSDDELTIDNIKLLNNTIKIVLKPITSNINDVLKYIHDGHHIIKNKYYRFRYITKKIKRIKTIVKANTIINDNNFSNICVKNLRSVFKNLRISRI